MTIAVDRRRERGVVDERMGTVEFARRVTEAWLFRESMEVAKQKIALDADGVLLDYNSAYPPPDVLACFDAIKDAGLSLVESEPYRKLQRVLRPGG